MTTQTIPQYDPKKDIDSFRERIVIEGDILFSELNYRSNYSESYRDGTEVKFYVHNPLTDESTHQESLETCFKDIDKWLLKDPTKFQRLEINLSQLLKFTTYFGAATIDFLEGTITYTHSDRNPYTTIYPEEASSLKFSEIAAFIATYYAEIIRRSIEGFAKLDQIIKEKQKQS